MPEGGRRYAQRQVATRQAAENGGVERRNGSAAPLRGARGSSRFESAQSRPGGSPRRAAGGIARRRADRWPGNRSDSRSCSPRRSQGRRRRARSCAAPGGHPCSRAARFLTRSRRRRHAIRADRTNRCSCLPAAVDPACRGRSPGAPARRDRPSSCPSPAPARHRRSPCGLAAPGGGRRRFQRVR